MFPLLIYFVHDVHFRKYIGQTQMLIFSEKKYRLSWKIFYVTILDSTRNRVTKTSTVPGCLHFIALCTLT